MPSYVVRMTTAGVPGRVFCHTHVEAADLRAARMAAYGMALEWAGTLGASQSIMVHVELRAAGGGRPDWMDVQADPKEPPCPGDAVGHEWREIRSTNDDGYCVIIQECASCGLCKIYTSTEDEHGGELANYLGYMTLSGCRSEKDDDGPPGMAGGGRLPLMRAIDDPMDGVRSGVAQALRALGGGAPDVAAALRGVRQAADVLGIVGDEA